jgi:hypothetical protein
MEVPHLVSAWNGLVQQLTNVFTKPTATLWRQLALGWLLHRGPATVTGIIRTLGDCADRHWTAYHKFFYRASWDLRELSAILLLRIIYPLIQQAARRDEQTGKLIVDLHLDDTTAGRYGRHVAHAGWYKDASCSGPAYKGTVIHWAHNWIVGCVTLRLADWPLVRWALPMIFELYRKKPDCDAQHPFRTRQQIASAMVAQAASVLPDVLWRVCVDGQYATRDMVRGLPKGVTLVSRIRSDAALHQLPSGERSHGKTRGPIPKKGDRLASIKELAASARDWQTITLEHQGRSVQRQVTSIVCLWWHVCRDKPIRLVIVRDPSGKQKDDYFFCTDATASEQEIVQRATDRWGVEEAIMEAKQHLGFENTRGWCSRTVNRQAPLSMVLLTLVKVWYANAATTTRQLLPQATPWFPQKERPSFLDMLAALRRILWQHRLSSKANSSNSWLTRKVQKFFDNVSYALCQAA